MGRATFDVLGSGCLQDLVRACPSYQAALREMAAVESAVAGVCPISDTPIWGLQSGSSRVFAGLIGGWSSTFSDIDLVHPGRYARGCRNLAVAHLP